MCHGQSINPWQSADPTKRTHGFISRIVVHNTALLMNLDSHTFLEDHYTRLMILKRSTDTKAGWDRNLNAMCEWHGANSCSSFQAERLTTRVYYQ